LPQPTPLGGASQSAHGLNERRDLAPAGNRLGGVSAMPDQDEGLLLLIERQFEPGRCAENAIRFVLYVAIRVASTCRDSFWLIEIM
jgi:hypothetical protein